MRHPWRFGPGAGGQGVTKLALKGLTWVAQPLCTNGLLKLCLLTVSRGRAQAGLEHLKPQPPRTGSCRTSPPPSPLTPPPFLESSSQSQEAIGAGTGPRRLTHPQDRRLPQPHSHQPHLLSAPAQLSSQTGSPTEAKVRPGPGPDDGRLRFGPSCSEFFHEVCGPHSD